MSVQSNISSSSDATVVEQTALERPSSSIKLSFDTDSETTLLHWALTDLKAKFYQIATDSLAARDLWQFTEYSGHIQVVDELLENLFVSLNNKVERFDLYSRGIDKKQHDEETHAEFRRQRDKFKERFGWDE